MLWEVISIAINGFIVQTTIDYFVHLQIPETFIKNLAILAGFLCLFVIIFAMIASTYNLAEIQAMVASAMLGSVMLTIDILALGSLLLIYFFYWAFWRNM